MTDKSNSPIDQVRAAWELASTTEERREIWSLVFRLFHADEGVVELLRQERERDDEDARAFWEAVDHI